jgi:hypothetical protein
VDQKEIRVGIIGANAKSSWAKVSHVPAINGLPGLKEFRFLCVTLGGYTFNGVVSLRM